MTGIVVDNSVDTVGMISVTPQGAITVSIVGTNFGATGVAGWQKTAVSYSTIPL